METLFRDQGTLTLFLVFFVPGFVSLKVYDLLIPSERRDFTKSLFDAIAYSALNFAALFPLASVLRSGNLPPWLWYPGVAFVLALMPALWPVALLQLRKIPFVARRITTPYPRVWDEIFRQRKPFWIIVHLKDQRRIGGFYGPGSYTSHSPAPPEIYLEQVWYVEEDGGFSGDIVESTAGILITGADILALEFFEYNQRSGEHHAERK